MSFEQDIAQISHLIVLFSESYGSIAELGSFCVIDEIASKTIVFIDDENYRDLSFVSLGPLRVLRNKYGEESISVIDKEYVNIKKISDLSSVDHRKFDELIRNSIKSRLSRIPDKTTLNSSVPGHIIKLSVGLIQHYGALQQWEIDLFLNAFGVSVKKEELDNYLLCAKFFEWVGDSTVGQRTFFYSKVKKKAAAFSLIKGSSMTISKHLALTRENWKSADDIRFNVIARAAVGA